MDIIFMQEPAIAYQYIEKEENLAPCELKISVECADCLYVAQSIANTSSSVCVLNMANQYHVGGDYLNYSKGAQEESLIHRTDLLDSLCALDGVIDGNPANPYRYQLPNTIGFEPPLDFRGFGEFTCLFSKNVTVKQLDNKENDLLDSFLINVISSAAYNLAENDELLNQNRYIVGTLLKIVNQLRTAKKHGMRHLVLGAFGCGAFHNDPVLIAELYHAAIYEYEFQGCFDSITFAILSSSDDLSNDNYALFKKQFEQKIVHSVFDILNRDLIKPYDKEIEYYRAPFLQINSLDQMRYVLNKLVNKEALSILQNATEKEQAKIFFLNQLEHLISEHPKCACVVLDVWFHSQRCKPFFSSSSKLKISSRFELKLEYIFSQTTPLLPSLNNTLTDHMKSLSEPILARVESMMSQYFLNEDKKKMCYLIYLAIKKDAKTLNTELNARFEKKNNNAIILWLQDVNNKCQGNIEQRPFIDQIGYGVELSDGKTNNIGAILGDYLTVLMEFFLKIKYPLYYQESLFENTLATNETRQNEHLQPSPIYKKRF